MNKRFEELLAQAHIVLNPPGTYSRYDNILPEQMEKLLESIVLDNIQALINNGYEDAAKCLREIHFGVEA
jgi:hypothetical protein